MYCVGNRQNGNPKKDLRLPFSLVRLASPSSQMMGLLPPLARIYNPCHLLGSFGQAKEPERSGVRQRQMNNLEGEQKMNKIL